MPKKRRRTRLVCSHCNQSLAYTAYCRHQQLPHMYCPARKEGNDTSSSESDSTFDFSERLDSPKDMSFATANSCLIDDIHSSPESSSSSLSGESDSAPQIWDEAESTSSESDTDSSEHTQLQYIVCLFLSFFQLCFHVSDRAISHLLAFLHALFHHLSSHAKDAPLLKSFSEAFPRTHYSLCKPLKLQKSYVKYVVCPRCHRIYKELESECLVSCQMGDNPKCSHVQFPNQFPISKPPSTCTQEKMWNRTDEKSQTRAKVQTCALEGVCTLQHRKFTSETYIHMLS